jgi:predicted metal-binding membrane protein
MASSPISICPPTVSSAPDLTSRLLHRQRLLVLGGIALLAILCWSYLWTGAGMGAMPGMADLAPPPFATVVLMWWLMMGAMMLPAAAPAVLLYAQARRQRAPSGASLPAPSTFLAGYALAWLAFSLVAALVQRLAAGADMRVQDPALAAILLVAAGAYQLSPLKGACLSHCRSPAQFFSRHWRAGPFGALRLGILHGAYCVGCCWLLMALLFAGGVMNLALVALLTAAVSAEKLLPNGPLVARLSGIALIVGGTGLALL